MRINLASVLVDDQDKALRFYTDVLGLREEARRADWASTGGSRSSRLRTPDGVELLLEPDEHPAAGPFKEALVEDGIPFTLVRGRRRPVRVRPADRPLGVAFTQEPTTMGPVTTAVFDDTCGNLIQIAAMG